MIVCDKCCSVGDYKIGTRKVTSSTHESFDLCETCYEELIEYLNTPKRANGRKRTAKTIKKTQKRKA